MLYKNATAAALNSDLMCSLRLTATSHSHVSKGVCPLKSNILLVFSGVECEDLVRGASVALSAEIVLNLLLIGSLVAFMIRVVAEPYNLEKKTLRNTSINT